MTDAPLLTMEEAQAHPMWEEQLRIELGMIHEGAQRVQERKESAQEKGQMTGLAPVRGLIQDWLPKLVEGLKQWQHSHTRSKGGPKPLALEYLRNCDPYVASLICLRTVLDQITVERTAVVSLAIAIGRTVEHEQQVRMWAGDKLHAGLFHDLQKRHDQNNATDTHRARANIAKFNILLKEGKFGEMAWVNWSMEVHYRVGVVLLDALVRQTRWFEFRSDPNHVFKKGTKTGPKLVLCACPGLTEWIGASLTDEGIHNPVYKPTVVPPRRWSNTREGGYWTPTVHTPPLIRFKAHQHEQRQYAADEYDALEMPREYDAIHYLQEVPYRINKGVMAIIRSVRMANTGEIAKVPVAGKEVELPFRPGVPDPERKGKWVYPSEEEALKWSRAASEVYSKNIRNLSKLKSFDRSMQLAEEYHDYERFYFPHHMDFRGRKYPIPVGLQPQGNDMARGLLEFADGKPIETEQQARWLYYQVANFMGQDKDTFAERFQWAAERADEWLLTARWPLSYTDNWAKSDKPWQALAAIMDLAGYLEQGIGYVSHGIQWVDGTCNGIQHLSAMTRDKVAGEHVNLVPGDRPQDIYKYVAGLLTQDLKEIMQAGGLPGDHAEFWLKACQFILPRGLTKRPVMVMPYGGTKEAYFKYIKEWLDEQQPRHPEEDRKLRNQRIYFLATRMWDVVGDSVKGAREVMEWIKRCAKAASIGNQPITWTTATGFVVRHFYGKVESKTAVTMLDGNRVDLRLAVQTEQLDERGQLQGIAPNFVHSQDAATLTLTVNKVEAHGISHFSSVHDAFGTHAADMDEMIVLLREAFVEVHQTNVLDQFRQACVRVTADALMVTEGVADPFEAMQIAEERIKPWTDFGELEIADVLKSQYFFA